ncbi:hypothetical protein BZG36_00282 [Bifiguratus adelaidae]|uniref:F-box domain-containing protein n=1 Tax=Bifiguratus adelaidae TaxID=1938954 RepID=A0A261Y816_9FUNG|nr:hypothetical protein BZG36_00282 [Bifiguratus adelaidae]
MVGTHLTALPTEIIIALFSSLQYTSDYASLGATCSTLRDISLTPYVKLHYMKRLLSPSRRRIEAATKEAWSEATYTEVCEFFVNAPIQPRYSDMNLLMQQIPTEYIVNYRYPSVASKRYILDLFRPWALEATFPNKITLPSNGAELVAQAGSVALQKGTSTISSRKIFYDATLLKDLPYDNASASFYCLIVSADIIVAVEDSSDLTMHTGRLLYKDQGMKTGLGLETFMTCHGKQERPNLPIVPTPKTSPSKADLWNLTINDVPPATKTIPYLLSSFEDCTLKTSIRKGNLHEGDRFECVVAYENEERCICVEFCGSDGQARGYLMLNEAGIEWH